MHSQPVKDSDGAFSPEKPTDRICDKCGGVCVYREWYSSCGGYTDFNYRCTVCGHTWWIDGIDS